MKNISTTTPTSHVSQKEIKIEKPARRTLNFVRQFARVYQSPRIAGLPGIVLN